MSKFRIDFVNPKTGKPDSEDVEAHDLENVEIRDSAGKVMRRTAMSAKDQVWDYAYRISNKGVFDITELEV